MYLLLAALVSTDANAFELPGSNICLTPSCLSISLGGNGSILPPDWYWGTYRELGGNMNWFRIEATVEATSPVYITVGEYTLGERYYSAEESDERTSVYYVPAVEDAVVSAYSRDTGAYFYLVFDGSEKAPW